MKYIENWLKVATENQTLKLLLIFLSSILILLGFSTLKLALRAPLIIERGEGVILPTGSKHTEYEIEKFLKVALLQRFDTEKKIIPTFLSEEEESFKLQESENLKPKNITQKILINKIIFEKDKILVDADRVLSVDKVRSAFPMPLEVKVESQSRTSFNPFGLILTKTLIPKEEKNDTPH